MAAVGRSQSVNPQRVLIARLEMSAKAADAAREALHEANEAASKLLKDIESQRAKIPPCDDSSTATIDTLQRKIFTRLKNLRARHNRLSEENKELWTEIKKYESRFIHLKKASELLHSEVMTNLWKIHTPHPMYKQAHDSVKAL